MQRSCEGESKGRSPLAGQAGGLQVSKGRSPWPIKPEDYSNRASLAARRFGFLSRMLHIPLVLVHFPVNLNTNNENQNLTQKMKCLI